MKKLLTLLTLASVFSLAALAEDETNNVAPATSSNSSSTPPKSIVLVGAKSTSTSTSTSTKGTIKSTTVVQDTRDDRSWNPNRDNDTTLTGN